MNVHYNIWRFNTSGLNIDEGEDECSRGEREEATMRKSGE